jgi:hypothetical protein
VTAKRRAVFVKTVSPVYPRRCVHDGSECGLRGNAQKQKALMVHAPNAFVMRPYSTQCNDIESACNSLIPKNYGVLVAKNATSRTATPGPSAGDLAAIVARDKAFTGSGFCQICGLCLHAHFGVAELGTLNANVLLEVGLMLAYGKPVILTLDRRLSRLDEVPFDLHGLLLVIYDNYADLTKGLSSTLEGVLAELVDKGIL